MYLDIGEGGKADTIGFFTVMTLLEGKDLNAAKAKWDAVRLSRSVSFCNDLDVTVIQQFIPTLKANWSV